MYIWPTIKTKTGKNKNLKLVVNNIRTIFRCKKWQMVHINDIIGQLII